MNYKRLIPILLIKDGLLVRSELFQYHQAIGDPIPTIKRMSDWNVDELCLINIGSTSSLDSRRSDKWHNLGKTTFSGLVQQASKFCHCPLTAGGRISSIDDFTHLFESGADKCIVNSLCFTDSTVVENAVVDPDRHTAESVRRHILRLVLQAEDEAQGITMPHILANLSATEDLIRDVLDRMQIRGILLIGNRPNGEICFTLDPSFY